MMSKRCLLKRMRSNGIIRKLFQTKLRTPVNEKQKLYFYSPNGLISRWYANWSSVVNEAKILVDYEYIQCDLEVLFDKDVGSEDILQRIAKTDHPLLEVIRNINCQKCGKIEMWSLVTLLVSRAANFSLESNNEEEDKLMQTLRSQQEVTKIVQMILLYNEVHKSIVDIRDHRTRNSDVRAISIGNKVAVLSGDYLLAQILKSLADLQNSILHERMSIEIRDLAVTEFLGRRVNGNIQLPPAPFGDHHFGYAVEHWTEMALLSGGSLLGRACESVLMINAQSQETQKRAYEFGKHFALLWQAYSDLIPFMRKDQRSSLNFYSAPILFHIEHETSILTEIEESLSSTGSIDQSKFFERVSAGPGIGLAKQLQKVHTQQAVKLLSIFAESEGKIALSNMITAMGDFEESGSTNNKNTVN